MAALVTSSEPYDLIFDGGSFSLETALVWINIVDRQERRLALLTPGLARRQPKPVYGRPPLAHLDSRSTGHEVSDWQGWLAHPDRHDPYWAQRRFSADRSDVGAEVSFVGGWQDIFLPTQLRDYQALRAAGHEPYLLIGPWQHTDQEGMAASVKESIVWRRAQLLDEKSQVSAS